MLTRGLVALTVMAAVADLLYAEPILAERGVLHDELPLVVEPVPWPQPELPASLYGEAPYQNVLTYARGGLWDPDKDGFVNTSLGDVNPTGYVVMHFRMQEGNVRLAFGQLLASDMPQTVLRTSGYHGAGGNAPQSGEDAFGDSGPGPGTWVPEPSTLAFLAVGGLLALTARRRPLRLQP